VKRPDIFDSKQNTKTPGKTTLLGVTPPTNLKGQEAQVSNAHQSYGQGGKKRVPKKNKRKRVLGLGPPKRPRTSGRGWGGLGCLRSGRKRLRKVGEPQAHRREDPVKKAGLQQTPKNRVLFGCQMGPREKKKNPNSSIRSDPSPKRYGGKTTVAGDKGNRGGTEMWETGGARTAQREKPGGNGITARPDAGPTKKKTDLNSQQKLKSGQERWKPETYAEEKESTTGKKKTGFAWG